LPHNTNTQTPPSPGAPALMQQQQTAVFGAFKSISDLVSGRGVRSGCAQLRGERAQQHTALTRNNTRRALTISSYRQ
jgi:hypothetical protein